MKPVLNVKGLSKSYRERVLDDVSFLIEEGCVTGFIGRNGAGKTTVIKSILGLVGIERGEIVFWGKEVSNYEREIRDRIGVVFDQGYLYEHLSLKEMKSIIAPAYSRWDDQVFHHYMDKFQLPLKKKVAELSQGMRMKYSIALALSHHADLLIMDEPTSGLDPVMRNQLLDLMREFMNEEGKAVFFSTHITTDLDKVADQIIMLDQGKIVFSAPKDDLIESHALVQGKREWLSEDTRKLFVSIEERGFGFEGLTHQRQKLERHMDKAFFNRPSLEDIMVAYAGRD